MTKFITLDNNNLKIELRSNENTNTLKGTSLILEDEKDIRKEQRNGFISAKNIKNIY
jgi:hypothetical protein